MMSIMIRSFKSKPLEKFWETGASGKIDATLGRRIIRRLDALDMANAPEDLDLPGFDFHALKGFNPVRYTVDINGPWCITFEFAGGDACRIDFEQYH